MSMKRGAAAEIALGIGVAALGVFILFETRMIRVAPIYSKVGPGVIPTLVGIILLALGILFLWQSWRGKPAVADGIDAPGSLLDTPGTGGQTADWKALGAIGVGLLLQIVLFESAGFIPTAAILFFCVAFGFGSRRYLRDAIIAILLATVAYVGFVHGLGLPLPAGILEGVL